jgi:hypothetical protein
MKRMGFAGYACASAVPQYPENPRMSAAQQAAVFKNHAQLDRTGMSSPICPAVSVRNSGKTAWLLEGVRHRGDEVAREVLRAAPMSCRWLERDPEVRDE